ncbi:MAG: fructosamine kinase family protein [Opitutales bacterium]
MWAEIDDWVAKHLGLRDASRCRRAVGGGCIHATWVIGEPGKELFLKTGGLDQLGVYQSEADGLRRLRNAAEGSGEIRVPEVMGVMQGAGVACLILEYIELRRDGDESALGRGLAHIHRDSADMFGLEIDNTIGSTPQMNTQSKSWIEFWREQRLKPQLEMAQVRGFNYAGADTLLSSLDMFFAEGDPAVSLLHGDLWGGNIGFDRDGVPVLFDPAVYYGDREADLAFTEVFVGFGPAFYRAYQDAWPMDSEFTRRKTLYNLYHILNHQNIFGSMYAGQAQSMIDELISGH